MDTQLTSPATLRQAAIACAVRAATRWPDDLLEVSRRVDWATTPDYVDLAAATSGALLAEHDRRRFGSSTTAAWAAVVDAMFSMPLRAIRNQSAWATVAGYSTDDPPGLWNALACIAAAARILEPASDDDRVIAALEASFAGTNAPRGY